MFQLSICFLEWNRASWSYLVLDSSGTGAILAQSSQPSQLRVIGARASTARLPEPAVFLRALRLRQWGGGDFWL